MRKYLLHLLVPLHTNNFKAKSIHSRSLLIVIAFLLIFGQFLAFFRVNYPDVLGMSHSISVEDLVLITNQKRIEQGAKPLNLNNQLSQAAALKARNMFEENYWAHNSPSGKTPWFFIKGSGYNYIFAGENLAKGFTTTDEVVSAWMASPEHRKNIVSNNYSDIGFAVVTGSLNGEETVLIVEMFGNQGTRSIASENTKEENKVAKNSKQEEVNNKMNSITNITPTMVPKVAAVTTNSFVDVNSFSRNFASIVLIFFIFVFILDLILVERRRIVRAAAGHYDHIIFLIFIFLVVMVVFRGSIL